ncbi:MAG TPA: AMP-binding protein [Mycobacteriales bacterium]|nr:AMP-binding protein [Mycobacteriales bacterium]
MSASWPPGLPRSLDYPDVPVGAILRGSARRWPDQVAFRLGDDELTFAQVLEGASQFAHALIDRGVAVGDVVALHMPNCLEYPLAYYGVLLAGATFSPANPLLPPDDLAFQLTDCKARVVVTWGIAAPAIGAVRDRIPAELVVGVATEPGAVDVGFAEFIAGRPTEPPDVAFDPALTLAHLAYTGGTTGRSKGVELPHRNVVTNALQYACWGNGALPKLDEHGGLVLDQVGSEDEWPVRLGEGRIVNLTPWFHAMGTVGYLNNPVLAGTEMTIHQRFDPGAYLTDAARYRVTGIGGAPPIFVALLRHPLIDEVDLSSVRGISSGAAPLPVEVIEELNKRFPDAIIGEGYGLTEVTMGATANPSWRSGERKVGTVGVPVFDTEVTLVDGEVCIRGPQVMRAYHGRPDATAEVLVDGWLHSGDIGAIDEDGYLTIVDRKKDMLIYKGYNVYPRELEELLFQHPAVANAAVVGKYDVAVGDLPVAFVVLAEPAGDADAVMAWVNERVTPYKKLREIHVVDQIPVSAAGKVLRRELREQLKV